MPKNLLAEMLVASRESFAQHIDVATAPHAEDIRRAEYGLSTELALLDGTGIGHKIVDITA